MWAVPERRARFLPGKGSSGSMDLRRFANGANEPLWIEHEDRFFPKSLRRPDQKGYAATRLHGTNDEQLLSDDSADGDRRGIVQDDVETGGVRADRFQTDGAGEQNRAGRIARFASDPGDCRQRKCEFTFPF